MAWHARAAGRPAVAAAAASAMASVAIVATRCEPATVNEQLTSFLTRLDGIASALATPNSLVIRPGRAEDAEAILGMIHDLAILEKELEQVKMTEATLRRDGWPSAAEKAGGAQPRFESFIAELDGVAVGFALYFHIYSTWEGLRSGLMHPRSFDRPSIGPSCLSSTASRDNNSPPDARVCPSPSCASSVYLEDLYVKPEARGKGAGTALIRAIAQTAQDKNCARFQWQVIDWNDPAIGAKCVWLTDQPI